MTYIDDIYCSHCASKGMVKRTPTKGTTNYYCRVCRKTTKKALYVEPQILPKTRITHIKKANRFFITSAVNDTALVGKCHKAFERAAKKLDAQYLVIPGVYKNPDLLSQGAQHSYSWPEEILPYVCNADVDLNNSLKVKGKTRIRYTAARPLQGKNSSSNIQSEIYGHPQLAMQCVATPQGELAKMLRTTMTISKPRYGDSDQAKRAEAHHKIGGLFVETEGDKFWVTEVCWDGQGFYLFDMYYTATSSSKAKLCEGLVLGDIHARWLEKKTEETIKYITKKLKPKKVMLHDVHDHHIGSHHSKDDISFNLSKSITKELSIRDELMMSVRFIDNLDDVVIVESNHHRHLNQWFDRFKVNSGDNVNLELYFELGYLMMEDLKNGGDGSLFRLFVTKYCKKKVKFVNRSSNYKIKGIILDNHGDIGPKGGRGSLAAFSRCGVAIIMGHGHGPGIDRLARQVGVMSLMIPYAKGFSDWDMLSTLIYKNGEMGTVNIVRGLLSPILRGKK